MPWGKRYHPPGTSPGTLLPAEPAPPRPVRITLMDYRGDAFEERRLARIEEAFPYRDTERVTWLDICGPPDAELLRALGEHFGLHPLALEDTVNTGQRPKLDDYDTHQFIVMRELHHDGDLAVEQVSLFLGRNFLITVQESEGDPFEPVRERIRQAKGRIRKMGPDYLAYALIDRLVDEFFPVLESLSDRIEDLEDQLVDHPTREILHDIHRVKRELLHLRRTAWPQREVVAALQRLESPLIREETRLFLRDCYDHCVYVLDMLETFRDLAAGMLEVYLSSVAKRTNDIMKVLTVITTIFIPLSFIAGVYGMNFDTAASPWNMPELKWYWGYPASLGSMAAIALALVAFFRTRRWL